MDLDDLISNYNLDTNYSLERLILDISKVIKYPTTMGAARLFSDDLKRKNKNIDILELKYEDKKITFNNSGKEIFKITWLPYDNYNTNFSPLRCSNKKCPVKDNIQCFISNDEFELGRYGLYSDKSKSKPYTIYRYIATDTKKNIIYEAFIDKEKNTLQKDYYNKNNEICERYYYSLMPKKLDASRVEAFKEKIEKFLIEEFTNIGTYKRKMLACDIEEQLFYNIKITDKKISEDEIYFNGKKVSKAVFLDNTFLDGLQIKGRLNSNKENFLALTNSSNHDIKLLCISDFVAGSKLNKSVVKYITKNLEIWFHNLDGNLLKEDSLIVDSLSNKIKEIDAFLSEKIKECRKHKKFLDKKVIGCACAIVLITKDNTYYTNYGDTRIYLVNQNKLKRITTDNTKIYEKYKDKKDYKELFKKQKDSLLTDYLGNNKQNISFNKIDNNCYSKLFIFSDGVTDNLNDKDLKNLILNNRGSEGLRKIVINAHKNQEKHTDTTGVCYVKR